MLLVEQNATMALSIADHGYIMENGEIVMDGPAGRSSLADEDIQEFYLGHGRDGPALVPRRSSTTGAGSGGRHDRRRADERSVRGDRCSRSRRHPALRRRDRAQRRVLRRQRRRAVRDHRPERRRQDVDLQLPQPRVPPPGGHIRFDGAELIGMRPTGIADLGIARTFQNIGLFAQ